jgi:Na+-translocating ferredoxin:NAD+ oxidoreductase RnfD subunit
MIRATARTPELEAQLRAARRYLRSPKGRLSLILGAIMGLGMIVTGRQTVAITALAVGTSVLLDMCMWAIRRREFVAPSGAILTGLLIGAVLSPIEHWYVVMNTAAFAILSKHLIRTRWSNILNPAACGLVVSGLVLGHAESWWGALPDAGLFGALEVLLLGLLVVQQINKFPLVLSFLGTYFLLFTLVTVLGDPSLATEVFRTPDVNAALFFALFMLDDPPTAPIRYGDQLVFGALVAAVAYAVLLRFGTVYYLSAGLLVGNIWESWRRYLQRPVSTSTAAPLPDAA